MNNKPSTMIVNSTIINFDTPLDAIFSSENNFIDQINNATKEILTTEKRIVMIAGPSGSGKTTFSKMLSAKLADFGIETKVIEMDNYFKTYNKDTIPKTKTGEDDLEHPDCVDAELLHNHIEKLLNNETIQIPKYDFIARKSIMTDTFITPNDKTVFIIEGIHALNPVFSGGLDVFKVYINTNSRFNIYNPLNKKKILIDRRMERCFRRSIRDKKNRGFDIPETLEMWDNVVAGELKYVSIYKGEADIVIDSSFPYEPFILIHQFRRLCDKEDCKGNAKLYEILEYFEYMPEIDIKFLPKSSLLNEFVG